MARETLETRQINRVEVEDCNDDFFTFTEAITTLFPGTLYKITAGARIITQCGNGEKPDGIVLHRDGYQHDGTTKRDIGSYYQNGDTKVRVARFCKNIGKEFWIQLTDNIACELTGDYTGGANGYADRWTFNAAGGTEETETASYANLKPSEYHAAVNGTDKYRKFIVIHG